MSVIAGIDFSTHFVDVVLLDENTDAATWHRKALTGQDSFERTRELRLGTWLGAAFWDDVLAVGIEDPRGYGAGHLYRIQGAILSCIPRQLLVQPWIPSQWRKQVGLAGNASKADVNYAMALHLVGQEVNATEWPQDAFDAYGIALATRSQLQHGEAAA